MPTSLETRVDIIRQMFRTYGQEADEERIKGYLTVLTSIPTASLPDSVRSAMGNSGSFPPGPGEILSSWRWRVGRTPPAEPQPQERGGYRVGPGDAPRRIGSVADGIYPMSERMKAVRARAKELRTLGESVPSDWVGGNLLGHIKAAIELNVEWPLSPEVRRRLSADMLLHEENGGDAAWWWEECREPTVTR